jgi:cytochrome c oxidase subunit 2
VKLTNGETVVADEVHIRQCILNPNSRRVAGYPPIMPSFQGQLGEEEIVQLTAYIKSLANLENDPRKAGTQ